MQTLSRSSVNGSLFTPAKFENPSIIAIPGLGSHALGSWKSPSGNDIWLRDYLPSDIARIRVLLYGYDTRLPGSQSKQSLDDLGVGLLMRIIAFRANNDVSNFYRI